MTDRSRSEGAPLDPPIGIDLETLAAFVDGRLSDKDRTRVMERLAASEDDRELLADVLTSLSAVSGASDGRDVSDDASGRVEGNGPSSAPGFWRRRWRGSLLLAAILVGLVTVPFFTGSDGEIDVVRTLYQDLAPLRTDGTGVPLPPLVGIDAIRSGAGISVPTGSGRAFLRGTIMARLAAMQGEERAGSADLLVLRSLLLDPLGGGAADSALEAWLRGAVAGGPVSWAQASQAIATLEGQPGAFGLGLRIERARLLALLGQDDAFSREDWEAIERGFGALTPEVRAGARSAFDRLSDAAERAPLDPLRLASALEEFSRVMIDA